ncbi:DUF937 domain-containing protein [Dinghuibacter silviterrae]|uniref:Uncharacterized protein n=1 Tax=Dinghuibacter silviterrae TaxID=1539049 RepID=A0A4R8DXT2_9BACT|nr:DUF937 domain-containing protein [Dinghuibacter silviterrae]TDX02365.1 hypothetical protein EDB95_3423 [Dinghuibacter silviterrae]
MTSILIESVKAFFNEDLRHHISVRLGEHDEDVYLAMGAAPPAFLAALLYRTELSEGPLSFYHLAHQAVGQDLYGWLREWDNGTGGLLAGNALSATGREYVQAVLGEYAEPMTEELARYAGVKNDTGAFLLGLSAFAVLDAAGRYLREAHLDVAAATRWLWDQRDGIVQALPSGLRVAPSLGLKRLPGAGDVSSARRSSLVYGVIAIIILAGLLFYVFKSCTGAPAFGQ